MCLEESSPRACVYMGYSCDAACLKKDPTSNEFWGLPFAVVLKADGCGLSLKGLWST